MLSPNVYQKLNQVMCYPLSLILWMNKQTDQMDTISSLGILNSPNYSIIDQSNQSNTRTFTLRPVYLHGLLRTIGLS